jgi:hypothetical protein
MKRPVLLLACSVLTGCTVGLGGTTNNTTNNNSGPCDAAGGNNSVNCPSVQASNPATAAATITSTPQQSREQKTVTYIVNPTKWAPPPVPGLTLTKGDIVSIRQIRGQWTCAPGAPGVGPTGIRGNTTYEAVYHSWAVPSAPFCSLIGKIGDGPWQELGYQPQFTAPRSGSLVLTANDLMPENCSQPPVNTSCYTDNEGAITIVITIY